MKLRAEWLTHLGLQHWVLAPNARGTGTGAVQCHWLTAGVWAVTPKAVAPPHPTALASSYTDAAPWCDQGVQAFHGLTGFPRKEGGEREETAY